MTFRALELRTEVMLMDGVSTFEDMGDHVIQRTPGEPDYWEGNRLILKLADVPAERALAEFDAAFPQAGHLAITFDVPDMPPGAQDPAFVAAGCTVERCDTLMLTDELAPASPAEGIALRPLETDADWEQSHRLALDWARADGYDLVQYEGFHRRRFARWRTKVDAGRGVWIGAFDGELLVGQMGIFVGNGLARYQHVQTAATHTGRGIASAMLVDCADRARQIDPEATIVIVADEGSAAGRIYRRAGFSRVETLTFLNRRDV